MVNKNQKIKKIKNKTIATTKKRVLCKQETNTHFKPENVAENHMP